MIAGEATYADATQSPNQAMHLTASKPAVHAFCLCHRGRMLRCMHRGLAAAELTARQMLVRMICYIAALATWALLLSSCLTIADAPVSGRMRDVSVGDIKHAVVAGRNTPKNRGAYTIYKIEVRNADEIYLYTSPDARRFDYIKREKDRWRYQSDGFTLEHFVPASGY